MKRLLFFALLAHSAAILIYRWDWPLTSPHAFREAQTAITVQYLSNGWFDYQTPVMGYPWTIPFEFPLMQWIAWCVWHLGIPLDAAGRLVSWTMGIVVLLPLWKICSHLRLDPWIAACLYLASPIYLFWGTSFLIDTTALFLAMMFLMYAMEEKWLLALLFGSLTALVKLPTLVPFAVCAFLLALSGLHGRILPRAAILSAPS